jgi:hypothetical protein
MKPSIVLSFGSQVLQRPFHRVPGATGLDLETWDSNPLKLELPDFRWARRRSVVIGAAQIIPALRAHQLAVVPAEPLSAIWANLAVVIDLRRVGTSHLTM